MKKLNANVSWVFVVFWGGFLVGLFFKEVPKGMKHDGKNSLALCRQKYKNHM